MDPAQDRANVDYAAPTREMRAALQEQGVALPEGEELAELSREYNERLERARKLNNKEGYMPVRRRTRAPHLAAGMKSPDA